MNDDVRAMNSAELLHLYGHLRVERVTYKGGQSLEDEEQILRDLKVVEKELLARLHERDQLIGMVIVIENKGD